MITKAHLVLKDEDEFSITVTATVGDWKALCRQIDKMNDGRAGVAWPLSNITHQIREVFDALGKTYMAVNEGKP